MGWHEDHLQAVRKRWKEKKAQTNLSEKEFMRQARKFLLEGGWSKEDVERILK
ncbi:TPA: hypothetical protein KZI03_000554 [Listeria monocytogenes]|nr:hypothetical protein [Listeria monocytogenes]HBI2193195.1 hypothetical protein [Listeria monocytogenes]